MREDRSRQLLRLLSCFAGRRGADFDRAVRGIGSNQQVELGTAANALASSGCAAGVEKHNPQIGGNVLHLGAQVRERQRAARKMKALLVAVAGVVEQQDDAAAGALNFRGSASRFGQRLQQLLGASAERDDCPVGADVPQLDQHIPEAIRVSLGISERFVLGGADVGAGDHRQAFLRGSARGPGAQQHRRADGSAPGAHSHRSARTTEPTGAHCSPGATLSSRARSNADSSR